jgi:hypothetical protein
MEKLDIKKFLNYVRINAPVNPNKPMDMKQLELILYCIDKDYLMLYGDGDNYKLSPNGGNYLMGLQKEATTITEHHGTGHVFLNPSIHNSLFNSDINLASHNIQSGYTQPIKKNWIEISYWIVGILVSLTLLYEFILKQHIGRL